MGFGTISRQEVIKQLVDRDGLKCYLFDCSLPFDEADPPTIDHYMPQDWCRRQGWTYEQINALENLRLAHKKCNSLKSNIVPNEDGSIDLPPRPERSMKLPRLMVCQLCLSGRLLLGGEVCELCGSGPQPATAPKHLQVGVKQCDHDTTFCPFCYTGMIPRKSALEHLLIGP